MSDNGDDLKILFITRKYPPQIGGMEKLSYRVTQGVKGHNKIIALKKSKWHIIWFMPYALIRGFIQAPNYSVVHLGDPTLAFIGWMIKKIRHKPVSVTVHGLDITYNNKLYQWYLRTFADNLDQYICISKNTEKLAREKNYKNTIIIPVGVDVHSIEKISDKLPSLIKKNIYNKKVILTVGRLVKRKGVEWFIRKILPEIKEDVIYVVVGKGKEADNINESIKQSNQENRVLMIGEADNDQLEAIYQIADLCVLPNIPVKGDVEGFGMAALEPTIYGKLVVAADLEGLKDAITHMENGILIPTQNANSFIDVITNYLDNDQQRKEFGNQARNYTINHFNWNIITEQYFQAFKKLGQN
ncbi:glycosyltransferase family 4 protein [Patescibacteria group bacterium]